MSRSERVTVSSVGAEWFEGTGTGYAIQPGGATFRHRRHPDLAWSIGGGDICHVVLGNGGTTWRMADASPPDRDGWQHVPVDPRVVAARVAGISHGFLAFDDTGSEWTRNGDVVHVPALPQPLRLQPGAEPRKRPLFHVEPGPEDRRPPEAPTRACVSSRDFDSCRPARPSSRGSRPATSARPARWVLRCARRPSLAARADPAGRRAGRTSRDAPSRPEDLTSVRAKALGAGR